LIRFEEEQMVESARGIVLGMVCGSVMSLLVAGCSGCEERDDEQVLQGMIRQAAELAARHELGELMSMTTDDFTASPGQRSRQEVKGILLMAFRRYGEFEVEHPRPTVEVAPSKLTATAELPFLIVRQDVDLPELSDLYEDPQGWIEAVGEKADAYFLELRFEKTDDGWRVERAVIQGTRGPSGLRVPAVPGRSRM
jgi:hypothetical protein